MVLECIYYEMQVVCLMGLIMYLDGLSFNVLKWSLLFYLLHYDIIMMMNNGLNL